MVKQVRSAIWYSDPGHAWLAVAGSLIRDLKIQDRISRYSYKGQDSTVYLEEDCDAPELIAAANAAGFVHSQACTLLKGGNYENHKEPNASTRKAIRSHGIARRVVFVFSAQSGADAMRRWRACYSLVQYVDRN